MIWYVSVGDKNWYDMIISWRQKHDHGDENCLTTWVHALYKSEHWDGFFICVFFVFILIFSALLINVEVKKNFVVQLLWSSVSLSAELLIILHKLKWQSPWTWLRRWYPIFKTQSLLQWVAYGRFENSSPVASLKYYFGVKNVLLDRLISTFLDNWIMVVPREKISQPVLDWWTTGLHEFSNAIMLIFLS